MKSDILQFPPLEAMELVSPPLRARRVAVMLVILFWILAVVLILVPWQQNITGAGRVAALTPVQRQQTIDAPVEGRILRWHAVEGTRVAKGALVAEISDNDPSLLDRIRREREAADERLTAARLSEQSAGDRIAGLQASRQNAIDAAQSRVDMAAERVRAAERGLDAADAAFTTAKLNINRQKNLHTKGLTPTRAVELAQLDYDRSLAEVERGKAALNSARQELDALKADRLRVENDFRASIDDARATRAGAAAEAANAKAALQPIDVRIARQSTQQIQAPRDGVIFRLLAQPGSEVLKAGDPVAVLVPDTAEPVVELWIDGNDMPLVSPGNKVRLQFEGWPAIQFVGWPSVAVGTFGGVVTLVDATDNGEGKFRLLVAPDPADEAWPSSRYLRQGVRANGWVLLNQVKLGFELWRQFNGFPPVISSTEPGASGPGGKAKK